MLQGQPSQSYQKRFQIKSGHVEYKLSGSVTGSKSLWFDEFGDKYREEIHTEEIVKIGKRTETVVNKSLSVFDGTWYYTINLATMEGTKIHKDAVPDFSILGSGLNDGEMEQLGESLLGAFGGKVEKKNETILGRQCDVTNMMGATVYVYKGVVPGSSVKIGAVENIEEALSFEENISVPGSRFSIPDQVSLEDVSSDVGAQLGYGEDVDDEEFSFRYLL